MLTSRSCLEAMNLLSFRFPDVFSSLPVQTKREQKKLEEESRDKLISLKLLSLVNGHSFTGSAPRGAGRGFQ
jgi:hypothetical protein